MSLRRLSSVVSGVVLVGSLGLASPAVAAPPEPSAIAVSSTTLAPGETFTITFELHNPQNFTVTSANASLSALEAPIVDLLDLVSCTGSNSVCHTFFSTFRGPVGDLPAGQSRTVVFTFQVKDTVAAGTYTLEHQFVGGNFAFAAGTGPVLTITSEPADLGVSLNASAQGLLVSRITYTVTVVNNGPADATGVRIGGIYAAGLSWVSGNGCVRGSGRSVQCDFAAIPAGGTATASFRVDAGLLTIGTFTTHVARVASSPSDPNIGNDGASRSCTALTSLLVAC
jgi:hypothetical protein